MISWYDLTEKEKFEFDYDNAEESSFFRYKKWVYTLDDFMRLDKNSPLSKNWHGYSSDSFFSGILIELNHSNDGVKVATYFS